ncbi:MAG: hypothetical protein JXQ75_01255 [Phycisphaerae bacterium]|nr:hypothetical protein [Phycisphaerae bacterium]
MADKNGQYEQLTAYLDDELSEAERAEVERLLAEDEGARVLLEELRQTSDLVRSLPRGHAPTNLPESVLVRLERQALLGDAPRCSSAGRTRSRLLGGLAIAASVVIVITAGWLLFPGLSGVRQAREVVTLADKEAVGDSEEGDRDEASRSMSRRLGTVGAGEARDLSASADPRVRGATATSERLQATRQAAVESVEEKEETALARAPALVAKKKLERGTEGETSVGVGDEAVNRLMALAYVGSTTKADSDQATEEQEMPGRRGGQRATKRPDGMEGPPVPPVSDDTAGAGFEGLLAARVLANSDLRRASADTFANRVVVETDAETGDKIQAHIGRFMESHGIPDVRSRDLPEPIKATQPFYLVRETGPDKEPSESVPAGELREGKQCGVDVLMNVSRTQAASLITGMEKIARQDEATVAWTANDVRVTDEHPAMDVVRRVVRADKRLEPVLPPPDRGAVPAPADKAAEAGGLAKAGDDIGEKGERGHGRAKGSEREALGAEGRATGPPFVGGPTQMRADEVVALVISLRRVRTDERFPPGSPNVTTRAASPRGSADDQKRAGVAVAGPQPAPPKAPAASQPTSQGGRRGMAGAGPTTQDARERPLPDRRGSDEGSAGG